MRLSLRCLIKSLEVGLEAFGGGGEDTHHHAIITN